jgi:hypothetical protein
VPQFGIAADGFQQFNGIAHGLPLVLLRGCRQAGMTV